METTSIILNRIEPGAILRRKKTFTNQENEYVRVVGWDSRKHRYAAELGIMFDGEFVKQREIYIGATWELNYEREVV